MFKRQGSNSVKSKSVNSNQLEYQKMEYQKMAINAKTFLLQISGIVFFSGQFCKKKKTLAF
jgi:hypothetical protein